MEKKADKYVVKLLDYIKKLDYVDLLGIGNILQVEEIDPFEDYVVEILYAYSEKDGKTKKQMLKMVKDIAGANSDIDKYQESLEQQDS